jgi:ketosteroid isomerase-like protein
MNTPNNEAESEHRTLAGLIHKYYEAYESKDKAVLKDLLAPDFLFSSPNGDDHINAEVYFEKCWPECGGIQKFNLESIIENGDEAFAKYQCLTKSGRSFRNTEYLKFKNGKISEIEVFFGQGQGFASNEG